MTDPTSPATLDEHPSSALNIEEALAIAIRAHQGGDLEPAEQMYQRILQAAPTHPDAMQFLGMLNYQRGDVDEALRLLGRVVELYPDYASAYNNLGNILNVLGRRDEALAAYQNALRLDADDVSAYCNIGALLAAQGRLQAAINLYSEAIKRNPQHADTFYHLGQALARLGRDEDAVQAYYHAITANVRHGAAYRGLGEALYRLERPDEASSAFNIALYCLGQNDRGMAALREWLRLDPENPRTQHTWQAWTGENVASRAADDYIRSEFDRYADEFDAHLMSDLKYNAPDLLATAIADRLTPAAALRVLDAGCGTGLCEPLLRPYARWLAGVDLSPRMIEKARERGGYDALEVTELTAFMAAHPAEYDLIVSADTLIYFGDLEPPLRAAESALSPQGLLAFTVERLTDGGDDFHLHASGRYQHTQGYLERMLQTVGLKLLSIATADFRFERGKPVEGYVVLARKLDDRRSAG